MYQKNDFESGKAPLKLRKEADVWTKLGLPLLGKLSLLLSSSIVFRHVP